MFDIDRIYAFPICSMMPVASGVFAWGICLGVSADFFKYAANLLGCAGVYL